MQQQPISELAAARTRRCLQRNRSPFCLLAVLLANQEATFSPVPHLRRFTSLPLYLSPLLRPSISLPRSFPPSLCLCPASLPLRPSAFLLPCLPADLEDMLREVDIMERLKGHPNVVALICYHNGAEDFIVVMSKAVGGDGACVMREFPASRSPICLPAQFPLPVYLQRPTRRSAFRLRRRWLHAAYLRGPMSTACLPCACAYCLYLRLQ